MKKTFFQYIVFFLIIFTRYIYGGEVNHWQQYIDLSNHSFSYGDCYSACATIMTEAMLKEYIDENSLSYNYGNLILSTAEHNKDPFKKIRDDKLSSLNNTHEKWSIASYSQCSKDDFETILENETSPIYALVNSGTHAILIVDYDDTNDNWICLDTNTSGSNLSEWSYSKFDTTDNTANYIITVNESCLAKICPELMDLPDALSYGFVSVEWAYITGTETLSGSLTVPDYRTLCLTSDADLTLNSYSLSIGNSSTITRESGAVVNPDITIKSGSDIYGFYSSISSAVSNASSGQDVYFGTGTYSGTINMKSGVDVIGAGATSTYVGPVNFSSDTNCELKNLNSSDLNISGGNYTTKVTNFRTNNKIEITGGNAWLENVEFLQGDYNCGIDVNGGYPSLIDITSTTSRSDPGDPAVYIHNSGSPAIDVGSIQYKNRGIQLGDY